MYFVMILKLAAVLKEGGMTKLRTYFWQWVRNWCITNQLCWFSCVDFVSCILYLSAVWVFKEMMNFRCELQLVDGTGFDSDSYPVLILELVPKVRPGSFWFSLTGTGADSFNPPNQVLTQHWFKSQFGFHKLTPWKLLDLQIPNCQCEICGIWFVCWCTQSPNGAGDYYDFDFYSGWWQKIATLESKLQLAHEELVKSQTTLFIARSEKT
jgi:hypothetical protein